MYSCCYVTIVRWAVISDPFLGNSSVNMFLQQQLHMQRRKEGVVMLVFLNRRAAAQYRALASIIPGPHLIEKEFTGLQSHKG
jgi:hypothetical protein